MKNRYISCLRGWVVLLGINLTLWANGFAQSVPRGIAWQGIIQDAQGNLLRSQHLTLRVILGKGPKPESIYFVETHQLKTDDQGQLALVIGSEARGQDLLQRVPWTEADIWLHIELLEADGTSRVLSQSQFMAVPFAFHAETAERLLPRDTSSLRSDQPVIWNVTGNTNTLAGQDYLGTADNQALYFKTNNTTRLAISEVGQSVYYTDPGLKGPEDDPQSYPIVIQGGQQGMFIELLQADDSYHNFLTFADERGVQGAIERQTFDEKLDNFDFAFNVGLKLFAIGVEGANALAGALEAAGLGFAVSPAVIIKKISLLETAIIVGIRTADLTAFIAETALQTGVAYSSGGADYAEWLPKENPTEQFFAGEVVGVTNGKISRITSDAEHLLVVSSNPAVLGNLPQEAEKANYERIAFKGQVKVLVVGPVNLGDYLVPSGNNDGMAIAVAPAQLPTADFGRIIGVAWEEATQAPVNLINAAVGVHTNDLADRLSNIEAKLDIIEAYLSGKQPMPLQDTIMQQAAAGYPSLNLTTGTDLRNGSQAAQAMAQLLTEQEETYEQVFATAQELLLQRGIAVDGHPLLARLFDDPVSFMLDCLEDPRMQNYLQYENQEALQSWWEGKNKNHE